MKSILGIASFAAHKFNMTRVSKLLINKGLSGKIGAKEPVFSLYLRTSEHFLLMQQIENLKLNSHYNSYLKGLVLRHERNYSDSWETVKDVHVPEITPFKIRLMYDMKNLEPLKVYIREGKDVLQYLTEEQQRNLIRYLTSSNSFSEAEMMINNVKNDKNELLEILEEEKTDTYTKYTWRVYKEKVLGMESELTYENFYDFLGQIKKQSKEMEKTGYILLINYFYEDKDIIYLLNNEVVNQISAADDIYPYIELEALHLLDFKLENLDEATIELQRLLNYYDMGQRSGTIMKSIIKLVPDVNINREHVMYLRLMILEGDIHMDDPEVVSLIKRDRRIHTIFHSPKFFMNENISREVDEFLYSNLKSRDRKRIYKNILNQLIHSKRHISLPKHFHDYLKNNASTRLKNAYLLCRYYRYTGKNEEMENLIRKFKTDDQLSIRLYLAKISFNLKEYFAALEQTNKAAKLKPQHRDVIRNYIRNYHMTGMISKRYEYVKLMKEKYPYRLYNNEYEMALQEYELYTSNWTLSDAARETLENNSYNQQPGKVLFVLNKALPVINGYTVRSNEIIKRVREAGYDPVITTRLGWTPAQEGYPIPDEPIDDIKTYYIDQTSKFPSNKTPLCTYFDKYTSELLEIIRQEKPSIIHAASNFQNALPSLALGKALGIRSIYEVRGLWHYSQSTKNPSFYKSERFLLQEKYELECCTMADEIICISESLRNYLTENGVPSEKIKMIPNGVDTGVLLPMPKAQDLVERYDLYDKYVLGFVGSLTSYEGIELIFDAMIKLRNEQEMDKEMALLIVGSGPYEDELRRKVKEKGIEDKVIFTGRVPREEVAKHYSIIDIAPFPRIDVPVCHLVTPIKTYEAMSMEKKVIVSDVSALLEMVHEGVNGEFFKSDSAESLSAAILKILNNENIGKSSREWAIENRDWAVLMDDFISLYKH